MSSASCFHCELPIPKADQGQFVTEISGTQQSFCCPACLAVSEMISGTGLSDYYNKREGKASLPDDKARDYSVWDDAKHQSIFVKPLTSGVEISLYIEGMHCTACAWLIEKHCENLSGVTKAQVNFANQKLTIEVNDLPVSQLMSWVSKIGYTPHPYKVDLIQQAIATERRKQLKRIGITSLLMMQLGMLAAGVYAGDYLGISHHHRQLLHAFGLLFSLPLLYFSVLPFITSAVVSLKNRQVNMDVNIVIAIAGLFGGSVVSVLQETGDVYFDSIAMLCLFILIARFIEFSSRHRLRMAEGLPEVVTRIKAGKLQPVLREQIASGDLIFVKEGETISIDGEVVEGESTVEESQLTGEPKPLKKQPGSQVFAGSINHDGQLTVKVTKGYGETRFEQIVSLLDAHSSQQRQSGSLAANFTLTVALLAVATFIIWLFIDPDRAFWVALSVLVISCPCAFSLALPTAQSAALHRLKKLGVFVVESEVLLKMPKISHVLFDKTGTLTESSFSIATVQPVNTEKTREQLLMIAASLESVSRHPLASAFSHSNAVIPESSAIHINRGVEGVVDGEAYRIGSSDFLSEWVDVTDLPNDGKIWIGLCSKNTLLGWFGLTCQLREEAKSVIDNLKDLGMQCQILSGDHSDQVDQVAEKLSLPFDKNLTSEQKQKKVKALTRQGMTLMIGDGVNDTLALSSADVSVTLGESTDWVKQSSDVVIASNDLSGLDQLMNVAEAFNRVFQQNIAWALAYNLLAIPFAMAGMVSPLIAAIGMCLSSIIVVMNSKQL